VDHGEKKRGVEYDPYFSKEFGEGEGDAYGKFLLQTLKPFIDKHYRTKSDVAHTGIAGSSLGALISTYAILKYPQSFGSVGVFSPAYWIAPSIEKMAKKTALKNTSSRFWFYGGEKEGFSMMKDMQRFKKIIDKRNAISSPIQTDANGMHNEASWAKWFGAFYIWWYRD
jgi:alpha-glucosidase